uniref:Chromo domain-containing protein n=1 Tax=Lactuca sativa TaxID=4236 RepID=A0A9R1VMB5_LACSA|nr:hypothetical protein LSAT_V11C500249390 [Lactuca sativa]
MTTQLFIRIRMVRASGPSRPWRICCGCAFLTLVVVGIPTIPLQSFPIIIATTEASTVLPSRCFMGGSTEPRYDGVRLDGASWGALRWCSRPRRRSSRSGVHCRQPRVSKRAMPTHSIRPGVSGRRYGPPEGVALEMCHLIHNTFHVSQLRKCLVNDSAVVPLEDIQVDGSLNYIERLVDILDRKMKDLKNKRVKLVKVQWQHRKGSEWSWEPKDEMREHCLELFPDATDFEDEASTRRGMSSGSGYLFSEPEPPQNCWFCNWNCLRQFWFLFLKSRNRLKRFRFQFSFLQNRYPLDNCRFQFQYRSSYGFVPLRFALIGVSLSCYYDT